MVERKREWIGSKKVKMLTNTFKRHYNVVVKGEIWGESPFNMSENCKPKTPKTSSIVQHSTPKLSRPLPFPPPQEKKFMDLSTFELPKRFYPIPWRKQRPQRQLRPKPMQMLQIQSTRGYFDLKHLQPRAALQNFVPRNGRGQQHLFISKQKKNFRRKRGWV